MDKLRQVGIIFGISFIGELLNVWLPLPIPASIYGVVLLFLLLVFHVLRVEMVKDAGYFLIEIMPLLFVPAGVGLMETWGVLEPVWMPFVVITAVSTVLVMGVSGVVTQWMRGIEGKFREGGK